MLRSEQWGTQIESRQFLEKLEFVSIAILEIDVIYFHCIYEQDHRYIALTLVSVNQYLTVNPSISQSISESVNPSISRLG